MAVLWPTVLGVTALKAANRGIVTWSMKARVGVTHSVKMGERRQKKSSGGGDDRDTHAYIHMI